MLMFTYMYAYLFIVLVDSSFTLPKQLSYKTLHIVRISIYLSTHTCVLIHCLLSFLLIKLDYIYIYIYIYIWNTLVTQLLNGNFCTTLDDNGCYFIDRFVFFFHSLSLIVWYSVNEKNSLNVSSASCTLNFIIKLLYIYVCGCCVFF